MSESLFMPEQASLQAVQLDALYYGLMGVTVFFSLLITVLLAVFAVRYRKGSTVNRTMTAKGFLALELTWTIIPLLIGIGLFGWGAKLYVDGRTPPDDAMDLYVVGLQWMWKIQHPQGKQENNELHVPVNRPVKLTMISQDVIHSFFIPAFRIKQDVLPGRYTTQWFEATKVGEYHLFCAEYCGTSHASMIGKVFVMEPAEYERWLSSSSTGGTMLSSGAQLFSRFACNTCHTEGPSQRGPSLAGLFGKPVTLQNGESVKADEEYLRESILYSNAKVVEGYQPIMPLFASQIAPDQLSQLIEYIKSLGSPDSLLRGETKP